MASIQINPALNTLAGSSTLNTLRLLKQNRIDSKYYLKAAGVLAVNLISEPFRMYEKIRYQNMINKVQITVDPVFILGHWRSGTTYLQNLLGQDQQMGYVTTLHSMFPGIVLGSSGLFGWFLSKLMPSKRLTDNVKLAANYPMEEEFAMGNTNPFAFYHGWHFPRQMRQYFHKWILFDDLPKKQVDQWKKDYLNVLKTAIINTGKPRLMLKNPPNTGRIPVLLDLFPSAKFIHITRNPITLYLSTKKLYASTLPSLTMQKYNQPEIDENIFYIYRLMMQRYLQNKSLIPKENLFEIRFEELEKAPLQMLEEIYKSLKITGFSQSKPHFEAYINSQKNYRKNRHTITSAEIERVKKEWKFAFDEWNYEVPDDIEIVN